ncbi:von Willebrand factor A domain-containing protein 7-like, partial [Chelydra serpentina]
DLTEDALLDATLALFRDLPPPRGRAPDWERFQGRPCWRTGLRGVLGPGASPAVPRRAGDVANANAALDFLPAARADPVLHFDNELLAPAGAALLRARRELLQALGAELYPLARQRL